LPHSVAVLGRRPAWFKTIADWRLADVSLTLHDSPSEALAVFADGSGELLIFDTVDYGRSRHVVEKFLSLKGDADLILLGEPAVLVGLQDKPHRGAVRRLAPTVAQDELRLEVARLLKLREVRNRSGIVGRSRAVNQMIALIAQAAPLDVNVLVLGESGTGKELVARALHQHSSRSGQSFVSLNCGALSEGILESELFGHEKGAFTGAVSRHNGVFKRADGGTLFLDEVAELPLAMQTRFLRALETGEFTPVGSARTEYSNIRLVAATHRDLAREVEAGRFRQDLYYRLRVVVIPAPPLRDRREDVPILAQTFLDQENEEHGFSLRGIARPALDLMSSYAWPGNVRELRNTIRSMAVFKQSGMIETADLPEEILTGNVRGHPRNLPVPLQSLTAGREMELVIATLLEMREDIKQIKATLGGESATGAVGFAGQVVDTFAGDSGYTTDPVGGDGDLMSAERALIEQALRATGGKRRMAAERLGISERTLYRKLKKFGLG
jgi:DNA-binding NtrC family response regulator